MTKSERDFRSNSNGMSTETENNSETTFGRGKVLIAEKHPMARAALAALLRQDGYEVYQAENLRTATSAINQIDRLAVLLVDLEMPEWRSIVRHAVKTADVLVIGMEGNHPISKMYDLGARGIRYCFQKPIEYSQLRNAVKNCVRGGGPSHRLRADGG
jgi:DNA-binding NtrC family response regulator